MPPQRIAFTILGAALYLSAVALGDEPVTLNATVGIFLSFSMDEPTGISRCEVQTNKGTEFSLFPRDGVPDGIVQSIQNLLIRDCGMQIRSPTIDQRGIWTIRAYTHSNGEENVSVRRFLVQFEGQEDVEPDVEDEEQHDEDEEQHDEDVVQHIEYLPSETLNAAVGIILSFSMPTPRGVDRCEVQTNNGTEFSLRPREGAPIGIDQSVSNWMVRDCGMHIESPTIDQSGEWIIRAYTQSNRVENVTIKPFLVRFTSLEDEEHDDEDEDQHDEDEEDHDEDVVQHIEYLASETLNAAVGIILFFSMPTPRGVDRCEVQTNNGTEFSLRPREGAPIGIDQAISNLMVRDCGMHIESPTIDQSGEWTIRAYIQSNSVVYVTVKHFLVQFTSPEDEEHDDEDEELYDEHGTRHELVDVFPSRAIRIFAGHSMSLRLRNHYENMTSCIATSPSGEKFDVLNVNDLSVNIRAFDQCGVTVHVNDNHAGLWQLNATVKSDSHQKLNYYGNFVVEVQDSSAIQTTPTVIHVQRSAPAIITFGPSNAVSCQLRNPSGEYLPLHSGRCQADIPIITDVHEGYWTAFYSLQGKVNVVQAMTEVVVYDDRSFNATVTTSYNGEVDLLCRVRAYSFSFCQFVKPDGTVLNAFEGIGNDRYLYHGEGFQSTTMLNKMPSECGITILNPDHSDYGNWKCILSTGSGLTGSVLRVPVPGQDRYENVNAPEFGENVYAVKGDSFTVKCDVNAELRYCWVGSPNGTAYSVSSIETSPKTLRYSGMGLALGECGAVIPAAEYTDEGEWKCGMGISNGQEVGSIVRVRVSDTILMPDVRNVTIRGDQALQLSCSLIPGHQESIDYCRWIQPTGFGLQQWGNIAPTNEVQHITQSTETSCNLEIRNIQQFREIIGNWTCVGGLVGSAVEVSATIEVIGERTPNSGDHGMSLWHYFILIFAVAVIFAAVAIIAVRGKLRRKNKPDPPPKYEEANHHLQMPPAMTPQETP